jgi:two-component system, chemotaxis family, sensor kinase CheA
VSKFSINHVAAMLVLADADEPSQRALREALTSVAQDESLPEAVRALVRDACSRLDTASPATFEVAIEEVRLLVEAAQSRLELRDRLSLVINGDSAETEPAATAKPAIDSLSSLLPADVDNSLLGDFMAESREMLENAEAALLQLESDPDDMEAVNTVFRAFHTIKGTSAFFSLDHVTEFAHHAETVLSRVRDREIRCVGGYADLALRSCDMIRAIVDATQDALDGRGSHLPPGYDALLAIVQNPEAAGISEQSSSQPRLKTGTQRVIESEAPAVRVVESSAATGDDPEEPAAETTERRSTSRRATDRGPEATVRVRTARLDRLIEMVGELVIAEAMISEDPIVKQGGHIELTRKVQHADKIVRELQDLSMAMRMVPLKAQFQKVARLIRDLAAKSNKKVEFVAIGEDTEIDRNMVDYLADPLVHMVRNSLDHGIETPEARRAAGKSESGTVRLSAYHAGGNVVVELVDDGRGLDRGRIIRKAIQVGLIASGDAMTDNEVWELIFAPGFSTAEQITDVSGRGVGMDVVRRNIEALRGRIEIHSAAGQGTTFSVRLPLTLAITDGMLVRVGHERYIVPTINIQLSFRPPQTALSTVSGRAEMVMLRNDVMPMVRLHRLFGVKGAVEDPTKGLLMVVGDGAQRTALLVDELLGQQQVVAKSLGDGIGRVPAISGGAILGDGRVGLILDVNELLSLARQGDGADHAAVPARAVA